MPLASILRMSLRALAFALPAGALWILLRLLWGKWKKQPVNWRREGLLLLFVFYLAALLEITVLRGGGWPPKPGLPERVKAVQWVPIYYTCKELEFGLWAFIYPIAGNIAWFLPLGILLPLVKRGAGLWETLLCAAAVSFSIELSQLLLGTGITDIDDFIFNTLGGLLGFLLFLGLKSRGISKKRHL